MSNVPTNLIPTRITGLPEYTGSSTLGYMPYVLEGRTYKVQFATIAAVGAVPSSRVIATGNGLEGGGDLSQDRTISIIPHGVGYSQLDFTGVTAGTYGSADTIPALTIDATGRVTAAVDTPIVLSNYVPTSRTITAGPGLTGGGQLNNNLTISLNPSNATPLSLGAASAGTGVQAARDDHVHPAVDLTDTSETQGVLPLGRGGTGVALSPVVGAVIYADNDSLNQTIAGNAGQVLTSAGGLGAPYWQTITGTGTVTTVSVVTANGFSGSVTNPDTTPAITLQTTITGMVAGDGTSLFEAIAGTDYVAPGLVTTSGLTVATSRILGRTSALTGAVEEITIGTGLTLSGGSLVNSAPDQIVSLTGGTAISIGGSYPSFTITNTAPDQIVSLTAGTGMSVGGAYPSFTITNTAPDQIVSLTGAGTTVVTGTYPNFTITSSDAYTGTVTSVAASGGTTGLTFSGSPITTSGTLTLGGTLAVASGGTGATTASGARTNLGAAASGANSDITSLSGVTGSISTVDSITFDTTAGISVGQGQIAWNAADGCLDIGMGYDSVTQQVGLETYFRIKASAAITNGQCVMFTGAVGASGVLTGAPATGVLDGNYIMGVATMDIAHNGFGYITNFGGVHGINTTGSSVGETWATGDILYYNPAYTGGLTNVEPVAPNQKVIVAAVTNSGPGGSGSLFVRVSANPNLQSLSDVYAPSPIANGQILIGDGSQARWESTTLTAGTNVSITNGAGSITINATDQYVGTVTSVAMTVPTGLTVSGSPITSSGTLAVGLQSGYSIPTTASQTNWDTAYTDRLKWDGGATGLVAATGRTSLGATTVGSNFFTLTNPSAITFPRINADNTVSALDAATFRTAIGAGTGSGSVTSINVSGGTTGLTTSGGPITSSGTITLAGTLGVANGGTGATTLSSGYLVKGNGTSAVSASVVYDNGTNVGIGTSSPGQKLDVTTAGGDDGIVLNNSSTTGGRIRLNSTGTGGRNYHLTSTANGSGDGGGKFIIRDSTASDAARLAIDSSGNVGIGTSSPSAILELNRNLAGEIGAFIQNPNASGYVALRLGNSDRGTNGDHLIYGSSVLGLRSKVGAAITFEPAGDERMRITTTGNVGIGTTGPGAKLDVAGASATDIFHVTRGTTWFTVGVTDGSRVDVNAYQSGVGAKHLAFQSAGGTASFDGNLGVGTTAPGGKLHTQLATSFSWGASWSSGTAVFGGGSSSAGGLGISYNDTTGAGIGAIVPGVAWKDITFYSNGLIFNTNGGTEAMRITPAQNVGIGLSNPGAPLSVQANSAAYAVILRGRSTSTNESIISFKNYADTTEFGRIVAYGNDVDIINNQAYSVKISTSNTERMRIDGSGNMLLGSTAVPSGSGINFQISGNATTRQWFTPTSGRVFYIEVSTAASAMQFVDGTAGAERMRIDSSGNVGIGTSSPGVKLDIAGGSVRIGNTYAMTFRNAAGTGTATYMLQGDDNFVVYNAASAPVQSFTQGASPLAAYGANANYRMVVDAGGTNINWVTAGSERMRINSAGNLLIATTSLAAANWANEIKNTTTDAWPLALNATTRGLVVRNTGLSSGFYAYFEYNSGSNNGSISWAGATTYYNTTSDARIKMNIIDAPEAGSLIDAIKVRSWDFKADGAHWRYGMVAQELLDVVPEAVATHEDPELMMGVDYAKIVPLLIKEVQSLRARVAQLEGN